MQEKLAPSEADWTVEEVSNFFQQVFSKSLKEVSVKEVFSTEWDSYRKVSLFLKLIER